MPLSNTISKEVSLMFSYLGLVKALPQLVFLDVKAISVQSPSVSARILLHHHLPATYGGWKLLWERTVMGPRVIQAGSRVCS